jgi:MFS family permease
VVGAWVRLIVHSAVTAAVVVAAQLGAADALGILPWNGPHDDRAWTTLLTWVAVAFAGAVLVGALSGRAAFRRTRGRDGFGARLVASIMSGAGAAAVIGLAWLPAREVRPPVNVNAGLVISITAGAGVVVGLVLALLALSSQPMAAGVLTALVWVWLLAIGAAVVGLTSGEPYPAPRVGIPDAPSLITPSAWTGPRVLIIAAAVFGIVVAVIVRVRGASRLSTAVSGFGGPALVAAAYLIAGPGENQSEPYLAALLGVVAGLAASAVVAIPGRPTSSAIDRPNSPDADGPAEAETREPTSRDASSHESPSRDPASDVLISARYPVPGGPPSASAGRPAWAEGSGPIARAYRNASSTTSTERTTETPAWNADTLAQPAQTGRHAAEATPARSPVAVMGQPSGDPRDPWAGDRRSSGRHAAAE